LLHKSPIVFRFLPVPVAARSPFLGARALLVFSDLHRNRQPSANLFARVFDLTPAEAKLASLLATGESVESAAQQLLVSRETIRSQLKAIFSKTGTHGQGELVALDPSGPFNRFNRGCFSSN
jgi:DNA-binding CsgD family transcriptional regulator